MTKLILKSVGYVCLVVGILTVLTPIPTGIPLIAFATIILLGTSPTARRFVSRLRRRSTRVDGWIAWVEARAHRRAATLLKRTRPLAQRIETRQAARKPAPTMTPAE